MRSRAMLLSSGMLALMMSVPAHAGTITEAVKEGRTKIYELVDKQATALSFDTGAKDIDTSEDEKLKSFVEAVKRNGEIEQVIVSAWADKEYPRNSEELSRSDRNLANDRADAVRERLEDLGVSASINKYSMAERPGMFARTFNTESAIIKGEGRIRDANTQVLEELGESLRDKGGPGKAVVFVRHKGDDYTSY